MIEKLKNELASIEEGILYAEINDEVWTSSYTRLLKKRRILKRTIKQLERLELHKHSEENLKLKKQNI